MGTIRIVLALLALVMVPGQVRAEDVRRLAVTFVNPGKQGEIFWDLVTAVMRAAADDLNIELEVLTAERDRFRMRELGLAVVARPVRPDYLIMVNEARFAVDAVAAAAGSGLATLLLLNDLTPEQMAVIGRPRRELAHLIGSIVPDNEAAGYRMARAVIEGARRIGRRGVDGRFHIVAIGGDEVTPASLERTEGLRRALAEAPDVVLDRLMHAHWNEADAEIQAWRYLERIQRGGETPAGLWAGNDAMAIGAMRAFAAAGFEAGRDYAVAGLNWSPAGIEAVRAGRMEITDGGHFLAGAWAMVLLRDHADGHDFAAGGTQVRFPMAAIGPAVADRLVAAFGDHDWRRIDFTRFLKSRRAPGAAYDFGLDAVFAASRQARAP